MTRAIPTAIAFAAAVTLASALIAGQSRAHDAPTGWSYPALCCSTTDCREDDHAVRIVKGGWQVVQTGEFVAHNDTRRKDSPDGLYHICMSKADFTSETARMLCLFTPPMGF